MHDIEDQPPASYDPTAYTAAQPRREKLGLKPEFQGKRERTRQDQQRERHSKPRFERPRRERPPVANQVAKPKGWAHDDFLHQLKGNVVRINPLSYGPGAKLYRVEEVDRFALLVRCESGSTSLIYKHAIASVVVASQSEVETFNSYLA